MRIPVSFTVNQVYGHGDMMMLEETWNHMVVSKTSSNIAALYLNGRAFAKGYYPNDIDTVLSDFIQEIDEDLLVDSVRLFQGASGAADIWNRWLGGSEQSVPLESGILKSWEFINYENIPLGSAFSNETYRTRLHFPQDLQGADRTPYSLPVLPHQSLEFKGTEHASGNRALWLSGRGDGLSTGLNLPMDIERPVEVLSVYFDIKPLLTAVLSNANIVTAGPLAVGVEVEGLYVSFNGTIVSSGIKLEIGGWYRIQAKVSLGEVKLLLNDNMIAQMSLSPVKVQEVCHCWLYRKGISRALIPKYTVSNLVIFFLVAEKIISLLCRL